MSGTCYIHIGMHKTGTSAIEEFLSVNAQVLERKGVLYPRTGLVPGGMHHKLAYPLYGRVDPVYVDEMRGTTEHSIWTELVSELARSRCDTGILSSDVFMAIFDSAAIGRIAEYLEDWRVKIVLYLRRQDHWMESLFNEKVKSNGYAASFAEFAATPPDYLDFRLLIDRWAAHFGKQNIIVRVYERQQMPNGLYRDLLDAVALAWDEEFDVPKRDVNPAVPWIFLSLLRRVNTLDIEPRLRCSVVCDLLSNGVILPGSRRSTGMLFSRQERERFLEKYSESNACIARQYCGRIDGSLFLAPIDSEHTSITEDAVVNSADCRLVDLSAQSRSIIHEALATRDMNEREE